MHEKSAQNKMSKRTSAVSRRAWNILRLALLSAGKGGLFRNRLQLCRHVVGKGIRKLRHSDDQCGALVYGDRELSFDETPVMHVNMHRPSSLRFKMPHLPCIKPQVDFDYDFEFDDDVAIEDMDLRFLKLEEEEKDEGIDLKAEEFIAKFYEQIKLQRQISYLQYTDKFIKCNN